MKTRKNSKNICQIRIFFFFSEKMVSTGSLHGVSGGSLEGMFRSIKIMIIIINSKVKNLKTFYGYNLHHLEILLTEEPKIFTYIIDNYFMIFFLTLKIFALVEGSPWAPDESHHVK